MVAFKSIVVLLLLATSSRIASVGGANEEANRQAAGPSGTGSGETPAGPPANEDAASQSIDELLPRRESLFEKDSVDPEGLSQMDCHLRNVDFCFAGLLGGMQKMLPETDSELEVRCDEFKAATSCISIFNKRCSTFKVFAAFNPMSSYEQLFQERSNELPPEMANFELPGELAGLLTGGKNGSGSDESELRAVKTMDFIRLCDPASKKTKMNQLLRRRLFELASCANSKGQLLNPCIQDLKVALQVFYEPSRSLPLKPSCCAISRFRECARGALDQICGLSSWRQLEQMLTSSSVGSQGLKIVNRVCRREANKFDSAYCLEILPPTGLKGPPARRGSKASKLAKALDLISLSQPPPAAGSASLR